MSCCVHICVNSLFFFLQVHKKSLFSEVILFVLFVCWLFSQLQLNPDKKKREDSFPKQFLPNSNSVYVYFDIPNQPSCPQSSYNIFLFCYRPISCLVLFFLCVFSIVPDPPLAAFLCSMLLLLPAAPCCVPSLWIISSLCPPPSVPVLPVPLWQHDCVSCVLFCEFLIQPLPVANLISSASIKRICLCH